MGHTTTQPRSWAEEAVGHDAAVVVVNEAVVENAEALVAPQTCEVAGGGVPVRRSPAEALVHTAQVPLGPPEPPAAPLVGRRGSDWWELSLML